MANEKIDSRFPTSEILKSPDFTRDAKQAVACIGHVPSLGHLHSDLESQVVRECAGWLRDVYMHTDPYLEGDDLGTAYVSCGVALLAIAFMESLSAQALAKATGFRAGFVEMVIQNLDENGSWNSKRWLDLRETLKKNKSDYTEVIGALCSVLEEFWERSALPDLAGEAMALRDGHILGGELQWWFDEDSGCPRELCQRDTRCNCGGMWRLESPPTRPDTNSGNHMV